MAGNIGYPKRKTLLSTMPLQSSVLIKLKTMQTREGPRSIVAEQVIKGEFRAEGNRYTEQAVTLYTLT